MATNYLRERSEKHAVEKVFSGKAHHFDVKTPEGETHHVSIEVKCDCRFMGIEGIPNGRICSHIHASLKALMEHKWVIQELMKVSNLSEPQILKSIPLELVQEKEEIIK